MLTACVLALAPAQYSWIPGTFPGQGSACPWTDVRSIFCCALRTELRGWRGHCAAQDYVKKPAYEGIIEGFE